MESGGNMNYFQKPCILMCLFTWFLFQKNVWKPSAFTEITWAPAFSTHRHFAWVPGPGRYRKRAQVVPSSIGHSSAHLLRPAKRKGGTYRLTREKLFFRATKEELSWTPCKKHSPVKVFKRAFFSVDRLVSVRTLAVTYPFIVQDIFNSKSHAGHSVLHCWNIV